MLNSNHNSGFISTSLSEKGSDPLRRGTKGQTPFRTSSNTSKFVFAGLCVMITGIAACTGCKSESGMDQIEVFEDANASTSGSFRRALDFLERLDEFQEQQVEARILRDLNMWVRDEAPHAKWIADPMANRLPMQFQPFADSKQLAQTSFLASDVRVLREATWLRDVSQSVLEKNTISPDISRLLESVLGNVPQEDRTDLDVALKLFDWVVRNIQTDTPYSVESEDPRYGGDIALEAWEALLFGHGTPEEKSRIFILLGRQRGLEIVMLGIEQDEGAPRSWCPALMLNGKLYLFEMSLGTPVLFENKIATLEEAVDNAKILEQFNIRDHIYPTRPKDLENVVAMIDATPAYLSQRMKNIESTITGSGKMILSVTPTPLSRELRNYKGISRVEIWTMPYEVYVQRTKGDASVFLSYMNERRLFSYEAAFDDSENRFARRISDQTRGVNRRVSLLQGRLLQFRGQFETKDAERGARAHYMGCRIPNEKIAEISKMPAAEISLSEEEKARRKVAVMEAERIVILSKITAGYWLGLMAFDRGEYDVAEDFLRVRTLEAFPNSTWTDGAKYNLGRTYEAIGLRDNDEEMLRKAIKTYDSDASHLPQFAQCQFRAKQLRNKVAVSD